MTPYLPETDLRPVDMSPEAVTRRLKTVDDLRRLGLDLITAVPVVRDTSSRSAPEADRKDRSGD